MKHKYWFCRIYTLEGIFSYKQDKESGIRMYCTQKLKNRDIAPFSTDGYKCIIDFIKDILETSNRRIYRMYLILRNNLGIKIDSCTDRLYKTNAEKIELINDNFSLYQMDYDETIS